MLMQNEEDLKKYRNEVSRLKELDKKNELEDRIHQDQLKVKNDRISELSREVNETAQLKVDYKLLMEKLSNLSKSTRALSAELEKSNRNMIILEKELSKEKESYSERTRSLNIELEKSNSHKEILEEQLEKEKESNSEKRALLEILKVN